MGFLASQEQDLSGHNLGHIDLDIHVIGIATGYQFALDGDFLALVGILFDDLRPFVPGDHVVPLGGLYLFPLGVLVILVGGHGKAYGLAPAFQYGHFGIVSDVPDQLDFVSQCTHD